MTSKKGKKELFTLALISSMALCLVALPQAMADDKFTGEMTADETMPPPPSGPYRSQMAAPKMPEHRNKPPQRPEWTARQPMPPQQPQWTPPPRPDWAARQPTPPQQPQWTPPPRPDWAARQPTPPQQPQWTPPPRPDWAARQPMPPQRPEWAKPRYPGPNYGPQPWGYGPYGAPPRR